MIDLILASDLFLFIVDTEQYAGNFERQLVAWMTGHVGECRVGQKEAERARKELESSALGLDALRWFERHIFMMPDESGCWRPATIYPTAGWWNDGRGNHQREPAPAKAQRFPAYLSVACLFGAEPPESVLAVLRGRARSFPGDEWTPPPGITGFRLLRRRIVIDELRVMAEET